MKTEKKVVIWITLSRPFRGVWSRKRDLPAPKKRELPPIGTRKIIDLDAGLHAISRHVMSFARRYDHMKEPESAPASSTAGPSKEGDELPQAESAAACAGWFEGSELGCCQGPVPGSVHLVCKGRDSGASAFPRHVMGHGAREQGPRSERVRAPHACTSL